MGSKAEPAEPWNQMVAFSEKCQFFSHFLGGLDQNFVAKIRNNPWDLASLRIH